MVFSVYHCNKIRDEGRLKLRREQAEAWRQGKPFCDAAFWSRRLSRSMGFTTIARGAIVKQAIEPQKYLEQARAMGFPVDNSCDSTYTLVSMLEFGDMPREAIATCHEHACTPLMLEKFFIVHREKNLTYCFDIPFEENETNLEYVANQICEFIEFAEKKFPGVIKYDENKLIELQASDEAAFSYYHEIFQMLKHKPSPIAGPDIDYGGHEGLWNLEYLRAKRDEVAERVKKGFAAVPGEKLRVLWAVQRPYFIDTFKVLAKWGIAVLVFCEGSSKYYTPVPNPVYYGGRKLTPLEQGSSAWNELRVCRYWCPMGK